MVVVPFRRKTQVEWTVGDAFAPPPPGVSAVGIDLGTTNSVVSVFSREDDRPRTLEFEGNTLLPSLLLVNEGSGEELLGRSVREAWSRSSMHIIRGTKRLMGSVAKSFISHGRNYNPEDVASLILSRIAAHPVLLAEREQHGGVWAVVTVPAHFDDAARQATVEAATRAGIRVLRIINEPTAAALAYSMLPGAENQQEALAVFDFGGGTFDVSVVERDGLVFNVLASEGDVYLGGDDIDLALAHHLEQFVTPRQRNLTTESGVFRKLLFLAEDAKIAFASNGTVRLQDEDLDGSGKVQIDHEITRDTFDEMAAPYVERTLHLTERAVHAARRRPKDLSRILLVGGSTRLHLVETMLAEYFPHCEVDARLEPDLAVSWGAALQAAIILGIRPETILVDVCSHTLGIGVAEDTDTLNANFRSISSKYGIINPNVNERQLHRLLGERVHEFNRELQGLLRVAAIIHRNSPLPAKRSEFFSTLYANQAAVHVVVVQGEGETVAGNRLIGSFLFELEQPCPVGTRCEIQLTYDVNGMVHMLAKQLGSQNQAEAHFDSRTGEVTGWSRIIASDEEPRDRPRGESSSETNIVTMFGAKSAASVAGQVPVNGLIARAQRALDRLATDSPLRGELADRVGQYQALLVAARDGTDNDAAVEELELALLDLLEGEQR